MSEIVDVPAAYDSGYKEGFRDGLSHAIWVAEQAKPNKKGLSKDEWIAVEITHDAVVRAIYNGLSN